MRVQARARGLRAKYTGHNDLEREGSEKIVENSGENTGYYENI